jgi:hypothetical protein
VPIDRFVAGTHEIAGDGAVRRREIVGEDGSRIPDTMWSAADEGPCTELLGRCVPRHAESREFVDDACSVPVGHTQRDCARPDHVVFFEEEAACVVDIQVFENAGPAESASRYVEVGGACTAVGLEDYDYWAVGDEIPVDELPALATTTASGDRIRPYFTSHGGTPLLGTGRFADTRLGVDCYARFTDDGEAWRCIPVDVADVVEIYYADDACTEGLPVGETFRLGCTEMDEAPWTPTRALRTSNGASCSRTRHLHEVGAEVIPGQLYQQDQNGICTLAAWNRNSVRRFRVGAEIDFDDYAVFRLVSD